MADNDDSSEKPFEATPRKLQEARKRGEVPVSQDLITASVYLGFLIAGAIFGAQSVSNLGAGLMSFLDAPHELSNYAFGGGTSFLGNFLLSVVGPLSVWFVFPVAFALLAAIAQNAFVVAPEKLKPKLSRVSPVSIAKQKFGRDGLFNFFKSFIKLLVFCTVLALVGGAWAPEILASPTSPFEGSLILAVSVTFAFLAAAFGVTLTIGGIDYLWQRGEHLRKHRMSLKELRDETKETEGDPHTKQARRQRGYDIATRRMLADIPDADVVIVNPSHFAVALKWSRASAAAPVCVAKGVDEVAARIRETAILHAVPIHHDPPTARAIHAAVEIGQEIAPAQYHAVAAAIRFADTIRSKARKL
ncbi:MAG: EscU/YscU/HrcU family type III secretion system export apparatus switch protein [Boseongicola sp.]